MNDEDAVMCIPIVLAALLCVGFLWDFAQEARTVVHAWRRAKGADVGAGRTHVTHQPVSPAQGVSSSDVHPKLRARLFHEAGRFFFSGGGE